MDSRDSELATEGSTCPSGLAPFPWATSRRHLTLMDGEGREVRGEISFVVMSDSNEP